jgi:hypothetical protein
VHHCAKSGADSARNGLGALIFGFLDGVLRVEGENSPSDETGGDGDEDGGTEERGFGDNTGDADAG